MRRIRSQPPRNLCAVRLEGQAAARVPTAGRRFRRRRCDRRLCARRRSRHDPQPRFQRPRAPPTSRSATQPSAKITRKSAAREPHRKFLARTAQSRCRGRSRSRWRRTSEAAPDDLHAAFRWELRLGPRRMGSGRPGGGTRCVQCLRRKSAASSAQRNLSSQCARSSSFWRRFGGNDGANCARSRR